MTREHIEGRMGQLREELTKANDELGKLRPRVQFLEQIMLRVDGALTVLQELLDAETPALDMREVHAAYTSDAPPPIPQGRPLTLKPTRSLRRAGKPWRHNAARKLMGESAAPGVPAPSSATKWWQWALVYPALGTSLFAAVPRVWEEVKALRLGVARSQLQLVEEQQRLWERNLDCISQQGIYEADGPAGLVVRVTLCPSADILVRYHANEWPPIYRWLAAPVRKVPDAQTVDPPAAVPARRLRGSP